MTIISYAIMLFYEFFVPVMGRLGNIINPEFIMMLLSLLISFTFVMFTVIQINRLFKIIGVFFRII